MLLTCSASSVWDTRQQAQLAIQAGLEQLERPEAVPLATLGVEAALQQTRDEAPDGAAAATPAVRDEDKLATPIQMRTALVLPFCHYLGRVGSTGTHGRRPKSNRKSVAFPAPACPPPARCEKDASSTEKRKVLLILIALLQRTFTEMVHCYEKKHVKFSKANTHDEIRDFCDSMQNIRKV